MLDKYSFDSYGVFFRDLNLNDLDRVPIRPLGKVSDYVVATFPGRLIDVRDGRDTLDHLSAEVEGLLLQHYSHCDIPEMTGSDLAVARLDSQMLRSGLKRLNPNVDAGKTASLEPNLSKLTELLSGLTRQPNIITYNDVARSNPATDPRTFTSGKIGHSEAGFYLLHERIEQKLDLVAERLLQGIGLVRLGHFNEFAASLIDSSKEEFTDAVRYQARFIAMKKADFDIFREFLKGYDGLPGASGLFSSGILMLDALLVGYQLPADYFSEAKKGLSEGFYPKREKVYDAFAVAESRNSLMDLAFRERDSKLSRAVAGLMQAVIDFRERHYNLVLKKIQTVASDTAAGTAIKQNSGSFLRERIAGYKTAHASLLEIL